jgi:diguanylate cyclase (GGDEF)-like protein/PAS domain S-box-containing protein
MTLSGATSPLDHTIVLLVDDQPANLLSLEALLDEFDARLLRASSGKEALQLLQWHHVALVLLDARMPDMDGFEVARLMQESSHSQGIPIIFITAISHDNHHVIKGYQNGAVDFLTKPLDAVVLKSKVRIFLELHRKNRDIERSNRTLRASLRELELLKETNDQLLHSLGEGVLSLDTEGCIRYANPTAVALLNDGSALLGSLFSVHLDGEAADELVVAMLSQCMSESHWAGTFRARRQGETFPLELTAKSILKEDGHFAGVSVVLKDVTSREQIEQKLKEESELDPLTGLVNRRGFERRLELHLNEGQEDLALLYIDLDHFKQVNDKLGHQAGDNLLMYVAKRLLGCTRHDDIVARLGGDEFCIVVQAADTQKAATIVSQKVLAIAAHPMRLGEERVQIGASIGVVLINPEQTIPQLLHQADLAMYAAKTRGRQQVCFYKPHMEDMKTRS